MNSKTKFVSRGDEKVLIGFSMTRRDLAELDNEAKKMRLSRAAFIRLALFSPDMYVGSESQKRGSKYDPASSALKGMFGVTNKAVSIEAMNAAIADGWAAGGDSTSRHAYKRGSKYDSYE